MELKQFLDLILPTDGWKYAVVFSGNRAPKHIACANTAELAETILKEDAGPQKSVYFACASYQNKWAGSKEDPKYRVAENQLAAKALWMDIDCGAEKAEKGAGYSKKSEAAQAVSAFVKATGLPYPLIVDSGGGLHLYWPLSKPLVPEKWNKLADALKQVAKHQGLLADPTRTADFASILRPPGSHNKKGEHKLVTVKLESEEIHAGDIAAALTAYVKEHGVESPKAVAP